MELDFLQQVLKFIQDFGGLSQMAKIAGVIMLLVQALKVTSFQPLWDKLGQYKMLLAPALGLAAGLVMMSPFSWQGAVVYLLSGAGAAMFYELIGVVKGLPGVSVGVQKVLDLVLSLLGPKKQ